MESCRPRQLLLNAASAGISEFINFFSANLNLNDTTITTTRKNKLKLPKLVLFLSEIIQELNKQQLVLLWKDISKICVKGLENYISQHSYSNDEQHHVEEKGDAIVLLQNICTLCSAMLLQPELLNLPEGLVDTVLLLHGVLLNLNEKSNKLAKNICKLCVSWWCKDLPRKTTLCLHPLIYLLTEITTHGANDRGAVSNVAELCSLKDSLLQFDYSDDFARQQPSNLDDTKFENIQELRQLLIVAAVHPSFMKNNNGRRFISHCLLLHKDLMGVMHKSIVDHLLLMNSDKFCEYYGNMYFQAWTLADDDTKLFVEDICIQDLMYRAIHLPRGRASCCPFSTFQEVLRCIVCHKGSKQVGHMLTRLYDPIIWRSLKANNSMIRANSASLLFDVFPLSPPCDNIRQEQDELIQRQFAVIDELLIDTSPQIRRIAICGLCDILHSFWDVIPAHMIAVEIQKLHANLAFDVASVEVREAVFRGVIVLLDNPCSHPILKKLLPTVGLCIHDTSEKVRIAFVDMLLAVKKTTTILFWDVTPIENILAQLEVDNQPFTKRVTKLLMGSFLPPDQPMQNWVLRCGNFFERNAVAARKFYIQLTALLSFSEIGEFMVMISIFVYNNVHISLQMSQDKERESEEQENAPQTVTDDPILIAGLLETICILWPCFHSKYTSDAKSAEGRKDEESSLNESRELAKKVALNVSRAVHVCFKKFDDKRTVNVLLKLSSLLPPASIPVFSKGVFPKLRSLPDDAPAPLYTMLIRCLVKWGWTRQILELVLDWLQDSFCEPSQEVVPLKKKDNKSRPRRSVRSAKESSRAPLSTKKATKKQVQFSGVNKTARPIMALKYLEVLLGDVVTFEEMMQSRGLNEMLRTISTALQKCFMDLNNRLSVSDPLFSLWVDDLLVRGFKLHLELCVRFYFTPDTPQENINGITNEDLATVKQDSLVLIKKYVLWAQVDLIAQLKSTAMALQDQNSSLLSSTSLNLTTAERSNSTSDILNRISLTRNLLKMLFPFFCDLLRAGVPTYDQLLQFLSSFTDNGLKMVDNASSIIALHHELHDHFLLDEWSTNRQERGPNVLPQLTENEEFLLKIFSDILLSLMKYSSQNPDGFHNSFRNDLKSRFRSLVQSEFQYHSNFTRHTHKLYTRKIASAILADLVQNATNDVAGLTSRERIGDLPVFSAAMLPILCITSNQSEFLCRVILTEISDDPHYLGQGKKAREAAAMAMVCLVNVLIKDSNNKTASSILLNELKEKSEEYLAACGVLEPAVLLSA